MTERIKELANKAAVYKSLCPFFPVGDTENLMPWGFSKLYPKDLGLINKNVYIYIHINPFPLLYSLKFRWATPTLLLALAESKVCHLLFVHLHNFCVHLYPLYVHPLLFVPLCVFPSWVSVPHPWLSVPPLVVRPPPGCPFPLVVHVQWGGTDTNFEYFGHDTQTETQTDRQTDTAAIYI